MFHMYEWCYGGLWYGFVWAKCGSNHGEQWAKGETDKWNEECEEKESAAGILKEGFFDKVDG